MLYELDAETGEQLHIIRGPKKETSRRGSRWEMLALSSDGYRVGLSAVYRDVSESLGSSDLVETRVWEVETGKLLMVLNGRMDLRSVVEHADWSQWIAAVDDGEITVTYVTTGEEAAHIPFFHQESTDRRTLATHPDGNCWAFCGRDGYLYLFALEGVAELNDL